MHRTPGPSALPRPALAFVKADRPVSFRLLASESVCITLLVGLHGCDYVLSSQGQWTELTYSFVFPTGNSAFTNSEGLYLIQKRDFSSDGLCFVVEFPSGSCDVRTTLSLFLLVHLFKLPTPCLLFQKAEMNVSNQAACEAKYYTGRHHG